MLRLAAPGATVLLNTPFGPDEVWDHLPRAMQQRIIELGLRLFVIDASRVAQDVGLRGRTNTVLQTCFFAISGVLPREQAIGHIKQAIRKSYGSKGEDVVQANFRAVDDTLARLFEVTVPEAATSQWERAPLVPARRAGIRARGDRADAGRPRRRDPGEPACRSTAPGRPAPRSGRSATSPMPCRCGTRTPASSAASAASSARMA